MPKKDKPMSSEQIGLRTFEMQRRRAVEAAVGRIRYGLGKSWDLILPEEIQLLEWILGETWSMTNFQTWERVGFGFCTLECVEELIDLAKEIVSGKTIGLVAIRQVQHLLELLPAPGNPPDDDRNHHG